MNVSACLVTRGNVDMQPILDSLPAEWEKIIWDNGARDVIFNGRSITTHDGDDPEFAGKRFAQVSDLSVYGRYAATEYASHDLIYVQDDDVIVSDPDAIRTEWQRQANEWYRTEHLYTEGRKPPWPGVVCNMPPEFRHDFYREHALVGFGAAFHRDAPERAFRKFWRHLKGESTMRMATDPRSSGGFNRCCDVVFTALAPRVLVDIPKENLPCAENADRMYRQASHVGERNRMLKLALAVRDAA